MMLNEKLSELRKANGLTQHELADALMVSRQTIYRWEKGTVMPSTEMLFRLAELYNLSFEEIMGLVLRR